LRDLILYIKDSDVFKSDNLTSWSQVDIINGFDYINSGYLWVVDDALFFMLNHNNFRYGKYNKLEGKFNMDRELPFWYNLHSSNNTTGLAMIDEKNIVSFKRDQGLKFSDNYGFFWQDLDDFKGTFIYDIAVKDDYLYVLNTYGLWKRSVDFLTSTTRKDNTLILNDIRLIPNYLCGDFQKTDKFYKNTILIMANIGHIKQIIGPVVDVSFAGENSKLPEILNALSIQRPNGETLNP
jgi:hypothetical protein